MYYLSLYCHHFICFFDSLPMHSLSSELPLHCPCGFSTSAPLWGSHTRYGEPTKMKLSSQVNSTWNKLFFSFYKLLPRISFTLHTTHKRAHPERGTLTWIGQASQSKELHQHAILWSKILDSRKWPTVLVCKVKGKPCNFETNSCGSIRSTFKTSF